MFYCYYDNKSDVFLNKPVIRPAIEKEEIDMEVKSQYIESYINQHKKMSFRDLLQKQNSKTEVIVTFLVVLEMMKTGKVSIVQENTFDDIVITSKVTEEV